MRIVDPETGRDRAAGEVGELWTRSVQNMKGYWNKPEETARVFTPDGWLKTGDAGFADADGYLFLTDRVKDMIVSGGENVYPAEVENALSGHPDIADVAVIGVPARQVGRDRQGDRGAPARRRPDGRGAHRLRPATAGRATSAPRRWTSWTRCRAIHRASS